MGPGILTRYNASAGSGKTYKLTSIYLNRLFSSRNSYKKILAVTFTNKAAAEMKRKILSQLNSLAAGEKSDMLESLSATTGKTEQEIVDAAGPILHSILHDYSSFSVGTIDSFFQRVLKAFSREIGLNHGYIIELDHSLILQQAVDEMFSAAADDPELREWLTRYSYERTEGGKSWNLRDDILKLADEIFREKFRLISEDERNKLKDKSFLNSYAEKLKEIQTQFSKRLKDEAARCREILDRHTVTDSMFFRGDKGVPSFLKQAGDEHRGIWKPVSATVSQVLDEPPVWTSKAGPSQELKSALGDGFDKVFTDMLRFYNEASVRANTALLISENIYILGILSNILEQVHKITSAGNRFLLSDAGELLWLIVKDDQTPFIYEKTGNAYENFMIDEFQDTSQIQWNNFRPLIENSLAQGHDNLVVGDVKQSIYRWRNSDWKILKSVIDEQIRSSALHNETLDTNWRSSRNIISFNNSLFTVLPRLIDRSDKNDSGTMLLEDLYSDTKQKFPGKHEGGTVNIGFIEDEGATFQESALARLPALIEELHELGYSGSDIGILVRTNREGASVLNAILEYRRTADASKLSRYNYNVISSESLLLSATPSVGFIVALLSSLYEDDPKLSLCIMIRNWVLLSGNDPFSTDLTDPGEEADRLFPEGYREFMTRLRQMNLFESVENIIRFFGLGSNPGNTAFLSSFQDSVLEFSSDNSADIPSFLEWWETTGCRRSVVVSDQPDSMRVLTIHKAKGLEFGVVILPFISWNMGHGNSSPAMWVRPPEEPFNELGIVPVRYKSDMLNSLFAADYAGESYSALADNINLLYVAFTRAIDKLYGFCPGKPRTGTVAAWLLEALNTDASEITRSCEIILKPGFNSELNAYSLGEASKKKKEHNKPASSRILSGSYYVNKGIKRLHLKFRGQDWLDRESGGRSIKINYGLLMHEILESVKTTDDLPDSVKRMVLQGRMTTAEAAVTEEKLRIALSVPEVSKWFSKGLKILTEPEILCAGGAVKRPDRVIISVEKVTVIDFKSGQEKKEHLKQVSDYMELLKSIEKKNVEGYLWYFENDIIIKV
jgi:ATP-dependent helicase/nuclease subunit A